MSNPSNPRLQQVGQAAPPVPPQFVQNFGIPTTDPNLLVAPQQGQQMAAPPAGTPPGVVIVPEWVMKIAPVIAFLIGGVMIFAQQRADVEGLKASLVEIKEQQQVYVTKQIFDLKMTEYEKYQVQMNSRFDKLEGLINGLYERLPSKREREK